MTTTRTGAARPTGADATLPTSALVWGAWSCAALVVLLRTGTWTVPVALIAAVALTWPSVRPHRRGLGTLLVGTSFALLATWLVLGVLIDREVGGDVLWVLPSYSPTTGGSFGGAVTLDQLTHALLQGLRGVAVVAVLALAHRAVDGHGWFRAARTVFGTAATPLAPVAALGDARCEQYSAARDLRRLGLDPHGWRLRGSAAAELWQRSQHHGRQLALLAPAGRWGVLRSTIALVVGVSVLLLTLHRSVASGPELAALALVAVTALGAAGTLLARGRLDSLDGADLAPLTSAVALVLVHLLMVRTGATEGVLDDVTIVVAVLVLPVFAFAVKERA